MLAFLRQLLRLPFRCDARLRRSVQPALLFGMLLRHCLRRGLGFGLRGSSGCQFVFANFALAGCGKRLCFRLDSRFSRGFGAQRECACVLGLLPRARLGLAAFAGLARDLLFAARALCRNRGSGC